MTIGTRFDPFVRHIWSRNPTSSLNELIDAIEYTQMNPSPVLFEKEKGARHAD
jgi:hypothetical protein